MALLAPEEVPPSLLTLLDHWHPDRTNRSVDVHPVWSTDSTRQLLKAAHRIEFYRRADQASAIVTDDPVMVSHLMLDHLGHTSAPYVVVATPEDLSHHDLSRCPVEWARRPLCTPNEAAEALGVTSMTIRNWVAADRLTRYYTRKGALRVDLEEATTEHSR